MTHQHIVVGLSGGVDSAVAAHLLKSAGHKVDAVFMKNWDEDDSEEYCSAAKDLEDAERVCEQLHIPLQTVNFSSEYWDLVFEYFLAEHRAGRTPNPDILCNTEIKFKVFLDYAISLGAEKIATGHYATIERNKNRYQLYAGKDKNKDQSYFLHGLNQSQLAKTLFPLGELAKSQVRKIAAEKTLHVHTKKDSTGICFIGERKFQSFLRQHLNTEPGNIVDLDGAIVGTHQGATLFTIGQRQGLGIGGTANGSNDPWYVVDKDMHSNQVIVAQGTDHPALFKQTIVVENMHWIDRHYNVPMSSVSAKIRYRQDQQNCQITQLDADRWLISFEQPQRAVTPGQYAVLYDGGECLGGGVISADNP